MPLILLTENSQSINTDKYLSSQQDNVTTCEKNIIISGKKAEMIEKGKRVKGKTWRSVE
jgi:hypothetical protein